jgi:hypothetical protein
VFSGPYTTTTSSGTIGTGAKINPKRKKAVRLPRRFTSKVLLAFLNEEESDSEKDVEWAANLAVERVEMTLENGETKLVVVLSMEDIYGNNPEDD